MPIAMKILRITLCIVILFFNGCSGDKQAPKADLSTPEKTIETRYRARRLSDFELFKKTHSDVSWTDKDQFLKTSTELISYKILKKQTMKKDKFSEEGEVYILVEEQYKSGGSGRMNFVLRKVKDNWLIVSFNAEEEEPIDPRVIEKKAKEIVK